MSRVAPAGHWAVAIPGEVALPLPSGDPQALRLAAGSLERAASHAQSTTTVRGTLATRLAVVWSGEAAAAARSEADELGRRSRRVVDGLSPTARSLRTYAAALELAVTRVRSLQRQWEGLDAEHALACLRLAALPDPTGALAGLGIERARAQQVLGRARLSRTYEQVLDELRGSGRSCAHLVAGVTEVAFPSADSPTGATVRSAVTGGLWFADGAVEARTSRDAALSDSLLVRRVIGASAPKAPVDDAAVAQLTERVRVRSHDPVYAQAMLSELGADGLARVLMAAGVARGRSGSHVDVVRDVLGGLGSLLLTATSHSAPAGTDPRTRGQLASGAALVADDLVACVGRVYRGPDDGRARGAWLLGQLLSGARAAGDVRRLPPRLARRAAAAAATAEIGETRDADAQLRHGTTLRAGGVDTFASWFDDASRTGDALHVLLAQIGDDPAEQAALLAEPLPDSSVSGGALANSRGDRLTVGEHLVRRWITLEASGVESHPDLHLATDADLARLLPSVSGDASDGAAEARARVMLELSRTSAHAMREASTTQLYAGTTAPVEGQVADWLSAMRENVDRALTQTDPLPDDGTASYASATSRGMQPWLDAPELTGVVGALAVDTGMGLHAKDPGAAYNRLVDKEIRATRESVQAGVDAERDVVRIGFFDRAASAAMGALARRQDDLNRSALQGLSEAGHVVADIRSGNLTGLASTVRTYIDGGTTRTAADDLVIALVRSDVELAQTGRDDSRRAELAGRLAAIVGRTMDVRSSLAAGARRGPALPTAEELREARRAEVDAAVKALCDEKIQSAAESRTDRAKEHAGATDRLLAVRGAPSDVNRALAQLPKGQQRHVRVVRSEDELLTLLRDFTEAARPVSPPSNYGGLTWQREDGLRIGERTSTKFGRSIDIWFPDGDYKKVHIDAVAKP